MIRLLIIFLTLIILWGCKRSDKDDFTSYEIWNSIIEYHNMIKYKHGEVFPKSGDTIVYEDFVVIPKTSKLIEIIKSDSEIFFALNGGTSVDTRFTNYFDLSDTLTIRNQINNKTLILDTAKIDGNKITYYREYESYFQADSLIEKYNKDLIFFDKPLFNKDNTRSLLCYVYLKKSYQLTKVVLLEKVSKQNSWEIKKQFGFVNKIVPKNNDWANDSIFYTIYVGSISR